MLGFVEDAGAPLVCVGRLPLAAAHCVAVVICAGGVFARCAAVRHRPLQ